MTTEAGLEQRRTAARTHGGFAIRNRGVAALTPTERGLYAELDAQLQTRPGTLDAIRRTCVLSLLALEAVQSYCAGEITGGTDISELAAVKLLPALQNSSARLLAQWLAAMPSDGNGDTDEIGRIRRTLDAQQPVQQAYTHEEVS